MEAIKRNPAKAFAALASCVILGMLISLFAQTGTAYASVSEKEPNGSFERANSIRIGETVYANGNGAYSNDEDYFVFNAPASGTVNIVITNGKRCADNGILDQAFLSLDVYNKYYQRISMDDFHRRNSDNTYTVTKPYICKVKVSKGKNYLLFQGACRHSSHPYHFKVTYPVSKTSIKSMVPGTDNLTVKWAKKSSVTKYQVRYSTRSSMSGARIADVSKKYDGLTINKLKKNKRYYAQVRVAKKIGGKYFYSGWSAKKSIILKAVAKPKIKKLSMTSEALTVQWDKVKNIVRHQVRISTRSSMENASYWNVSNKYVGLKIGHPKAKKYYVQVRQAKKISGKYYYSPWTAAKAVKR